MSGKQRNPLFYRLFRKLSSPIVCEILETVRNRRYTLDGLRKRLGKRKNLVCMHLSDLIRMGIMEKREIKGRMRYTVRERRPLRYIQKFAAIALELQAFLELVKRESPRPPRSKRSASRAKKSPKRK